MRALLNGVRDYLQDTWQHVEVAAKPDSVPDSLPYATVWLTNNLPIDNTNTTGDIDIEQDATVQVKSIGSSFDQAAQLSANLDAAIRNGLAISGYAIQLVMRERESGPVRDETVFPNPHSWYVDRWYTIWWVPNPEPEPETS
jgi:hypothetical protein